MRQVQPAELVAQNGGEAIRLCAVLIGQILAARTFAGRQRADETENNFWHTLTKFRVPNPLTQVWLRGGVGAARMGEGLVQGRFPKTTP